MKTTKSTKRERVPRLWAVVPEDLHKDVKLYAVTHGITMQEFVAQAVAEKLERERRDEIGAVR
jgi:hypothetical protein